MALAYANGLVWLALGAPLAPVDAQLPTLAAASLRPPLCREAQGSERSPLWSHAHGAPVRAFCEALARGQVRLERSPERALELAEKAHALFPEQAAALVLSGRALLRQGETARAHERFVAARSKPGQSFTDPVTLREFAVAAQALGRSAEAIAHYRQLIPRSDFLHDPIFRRLVMLEAASLLGASGPEGLPEVEVYLTEVRRGPPATGLEDLTSALLSLSLERKGDLEQARVVAAEIPGPWSLERFLSPADNARIERLVLPVGGAAPERAPRPVFRARAPMLADGELHAAIAISAAERDPELARVHLRAYLEGPGQKGPWAGWARARLAALRGGRR
jgi:tetratricopeptide (TPR) repeat protein